MGVLTGTIISGLLQLAGSVGIGILNNNASEKAGEKQYGLALLARGDELNQQKDQLGISKKNIGLQEDQLNLNRSAQNYKQQSEKKIFRQQQLLNLGASLDNLSGKDANMTNFILSLYGKSNPLTGKKRGVV